MLKVVAFLAGIVAVVLAMTGCTPAITCSVSVNSFAGPNASVLRTYVIIPLNPKVQDTDLEFQEYSTYVRRVLDAHGFRPARSFQDAQIAVFVGYGIGDPQLHARSYDVPVWGQTGVAASTTTSQVNTYGNYGTVTSNTTYTPQYGV